MSPSLALRACGPSPSLEALRPIRPESEVTQGRLWGGEVAPLPGAMGHVCGCLWQWPYEQDLFCCPDTEAS